MWGWSGQGDLTEEVRHEPKPEVQEGGNHAAMWEEHSEKWELCTVVL